jgi:hypothetical protein
MYAITSSVWAAPDSKKIRLGKAGRCRFCGGTNPRLFKQAAHLIPEALGNRWVFSLDECDECNKRFSQYEGELVNAIGSLLTLGGTQGKGGKVRQTGRSSGATTVRHEREADGKRRIIIMGRDVPDYRQRFEQDGDIVRIRTPLPPTPFKPMLAHKALVKMALAIMHEEQLPHFNGVRTALLQEGPLSRFRASVGLGFGSIGLAPQYVAAFLLRRKDDALLLPSTLFMLCAGSLCVQCFIPSDDLDGYGLDQFAPPSLAFNAQFPTANGGTFTIPYDKPTPLDWSSAASQPQPLEEVTLTFNTATTEGAFAPVWR